MTMDRVTLVYLPFEKRKVGQVLILQYVLWGQERSIRCERQ